MPEQNKNKIILDNPKLEYSKFNFFYLIILFLTLAMPIFVLVNILENPFEKPKTLLLVSGAALLIGLYAARFLRGKPVPVAATHTPKILILLLLLNVFNLFYTKNYYYSCIAAAMHVSCLSIFYMTAIYMDQKKAFWILIAAGVSGFLVAIDSWLQCFDIYLLFKTRLDYIVGTIGNSNHLGAYLLFPVFILLGLFFLLKGKTRWLMGAIFLFIFGAFLISRARASWLAFMISFPLFYFFIRKIYHFSIWKFITWHVASAMITVLAVAILLLTWFIMPQRVHDILSPSGILESDTLYLRTNKYWPPSFWLSMQNPLFGHGFWSYRNLVYEAQAEINLKKPDFFKNYPSPKPREAHNDLIEIFNEGGIILAVSLFSFLLIVLKHGWRVIRDENLETATRLITATAFTTTIGVMGSALFFFPFRVNTTMFMAALMTGIMEGMYLSNYNLIQMKSTVKSGVHYVLIFLTGLTLIGFTWFMALKPLIAEKAFTGYRKYRAMGEYHLNQKDIKTAQWEVQKAQENLTRALAYDPLNTAYNIDASIFYINFFQDYQKANDYLEMAINHFNGDIVLWSLYDIKGRFKLQLNSPQEAKAAFAKALKLYPEFEPAKAGLVIAEKALAERANQPNSTNKN
jgi:O-antigen ligase